MPQDAAHNSIWKTSDFIAVTSVSLGAFVEFLFLWDVSLPMATWQKIVGGSLTIGCGVGLILAAKSALKAVNQNSQPGKPITQITESGIFARSRNPSYLGVALLIFGLGVCFGFIAWILASAVAGVAMHYILVLPEERYLLTKFPDEYGEYMRKVRRWI